MKVIIPAAGLGSRLRPLTFTTPKAMLPVAGKPIIGHILDQVISWGGDQISIIVGHLGSAIEEWVEKYYDLDINFCVQDKMLGLGHAVLTGLSADDKDVLIILGDTILDTNMSRVIRVGKTAIGVKEVEDPRKLGVVVLENEKVVELIEKPTNPVSNFAIVGVYYIRDGGVLYNAINEIIERDITVKGEYQITDALQMLLNWNEEIVTFPVDAWYDCGRPETLLETNKYLFDSGRVKATEISLKDGQIIQPVSIGENVRIERSVVGPFVSIGNGSVIRDSVIKSSIIGDDTCVEKKTIEESIIGSRVYLSGRFERFIIGQSCQIGL